MNENPILIDSHMNLLSANPYYISYLKSQEEKRMLECPNTPLVVRLSGQPEAITCQEDTIATEKYYPSKETEKFYRF